MASNGTPRKRPPDPCPSPRTKRPNIDSSYSNPRQEQVAPYRAELLRIGEGEPRFEMLVVGCGGGPLETNLSSYLLKPFANSWVDGCTSLEGGSGLGALARLVEESPASFEGFGIPGEELGGREGGGRAAGRVWDRVRCFLVSHAHLDHIQGLIISSGASRSPRPLYGTSRTIANIERIFDGGVWPPLAGREDDGVLAGRAYLYREIPAPSTTSFPLSDNLSFQAFPVAHGVDPGQSRNPAVASANPPSGCPGYESTAFFITEGVSGEEREMLFFGDVEPDSISKCGLNRAIWTCAAPKIVAKKLSVIFLECSYPTSQPTAHLWGHLSPPFVLEELRVLAQLVQEARVAAGASAADAAVLPLAGVTVVIVHIKDDVLPLPTPTPPEPEQHTTPIRPSPSPLSRPSPSPHTLSMSPPLPSFPVRRASGGIQPAWKPSLLLPPALQSRRASVPAFVGSTTGVGQGFERALAGLAGKRWSGSSGSEGLGRTDEGEEMEVEMVGERIERELNELEEAERTGVRFFRAVQGARIAF